MRYALLNGNSVVENIIEWDGASFYPLPIGKILLPWASPAGIGSTWNGQTFSAPPPIKPDPVPARVPKLVLIDRLIAANLLDKANAALGPLGSARRERWIASTSVDPDNPDVRALLTAIGGDLNVLLAPPPSDEA